MKILVVSDSHGESEGIEKVLERERPDAIIHAGDGERDRYAFSVTGSIPVAMVKGNCDYGNDLPEEILLEEKGKRIFIVHGHTYHVRNSTLALEVVAKEKNLDLVIYGHTHIPDLKEKNGTKFLNPGSISAPRQKNKKPTYALIFLGKTGEMKIDLKFL